MKFTQGKLFPRFVRELPQLAILYLHLTRADFTARFYDDARLCLNSPVPVDGGADVGGPAAYDG